jgi:hypothetical protein
VLEGARKLKVVCAGCVGAGEGASTTGHRRMAGAEAKLWAGRVVVRCMTVRRPWAGWTVVVGREAREGRLAFAGGGEEDD